MTYIKTTPEEIRAAILSEAKRQFLKNGIANTEMKNLAESAGLSRSTLYRYVIHKNQLSFMVSTDVIIELTNKCFSVAIGHTLNGFEKLTQFAHHFVQTLCNNVSLVIYLNEFDCLFRGEYPDIPEAKEYVETMNRMLHRTAQFMFEGLSDGSIRTNEDPIFFTSVLINTIFGLAERLLPRDAHYIAEHHLSSQRILNGSVDMLLNNIKA